MAKRALPVLKTSPPPPLPGEVLYVPPIGDGAGRSCANCVMWVSTEEICLIHRRDLTVTGDMVCGYHVVGQPQNESFPWGVPVEPELSGLITAPPDGTRCGNCLYFAGGTAGTSGLCFGVAGEIQSVAVTVEQTLTSKAWTPAEVDAFGCCARWRQPQ